jgi:hypothetical protein
VTSAEVEFCTKDKRQKRTVATRLSVQDFVSALGEHIRDRYKHAIRYYGLLAPRAKHLTSAALFALIGQKKRPSPKRLSWRDSLRKYFGVDPLTDSNGELMRWVRRQTPIPSEFVA